MAYTIWSIWVEYQQVHCTQSSRYNVNKNNNAGSGFTTKGTLNLTFLNEFLCIIQEKQRISDIMPVVEQKLKICK